MSLRRAALPLAILALIVSGRFIPGIGAFLTTLGLCLAVAAVALAVFRVCHRVASGRRESLEIAAIGGAGACGLLFLFQNVLVHDALWYYGYLRSAVVQGSLDLYEEFVLMNPNGMYLPPPETPLIHLGTALLQAPAALIVRPLALWLDRVGLLPGGDGFGPLEVAAATWTSMMLGIGGVALVHRLARRLAGGPASTIAQVALFYASPLAFFTFVWPAYPHAASVFFGAAFLLVWFGSTENGEQDRSFLLGLLGGLLALIRPQDIVYLALPGVDLLVGAASVARRRGLAAIGPSVARAARVVAGAIVGLLPQFIAWWITTGAPVEHVYADLGDPFRWSHPAFGSVLFSVYNGLITWTPLCGAGILGIFLLRRDRPRLFRGLLLLLLLEWWAISSYGYWWGGASFGARYFLSAYPVFGIGLAMLFRRLISRFGAYRVGLASVPFVFWNLLLMAQYRLEWIPHNVRPDFAEVLRRQLFEAPAVWISGLSGTFRWNQVLVVELLTAARESGSRLRMAGAILLVTALVVVLLVWVARLCRGARDSRADSTPARLRRAQFLTVGGVIVATASVALVGATPGFGERRIFREVRPVPLRIGPGSETTVPLAAAAVPNPDQPTAVRATPLPAGGSAGLRLDVISFLHNAEDREEGELIARVHLQGDHCGGDFPLRAGIETAETAPARVEILGRMSHGTGHARVIQSWWQPYNSARHYWGHAYLASFELPPGCKPSGVRIRTEENASDIEIRRLVVATTLSGERTGWIAGL